MAESALATAPTEAWSDTLTALQGAGSESKSVKNALISSVATNPGQFDSEQWKQILILSPEWIEAYRPAGGVLMSQRHLVAAKFCLGVALWRNIKDYRVADALSKICVAVGDREGEHIYFRHWDTFRPKSVRERIAGWNGNESFRAEKDKALQWVDRKSKNAVKKTIYDLMWRQYAVAAREAYRVQSGSESEQSDYHRNGFQIQEVSLELTRTLLATFDEENRIEVGNRSTAYSEYTRSDTALNSLRHLLEEMAPVIRSQLMSHFTVCQVIFRRAQPGMQMHQFAWHRDGLPTDIAKILLFPETPTSESGTTELVTADGLRHRVHLDGPGWLLFSPAKLVHRGVAAKGVGRPTIEMTVRPSMATNTDLNLPDQSLSFPYFPSVTQSDVDGAGFAGAVFAGELDTELTDLVNDAVDVFSETSKLAFLGGSADTARR